MSLIVREEEEAEVDRDPMSLLTEERISSMVTTVVMVMVIPQSHTEVKTVIPANQKDAIHLYHLT